MGEVQDLTATEVIKLTAKDIDSKMFVAAINKLCAHSFSPKLAYTIGYIRKKVDSFTGDVLKEHRKLVDKYADKDESGNLAQDGKGGLVFSEEAKKSYEKDLSEVHKIDFEIRKRPLDVGLLSQEGFKFTPNDISVLEPLLCGLED